MFIMDHLFITLILLLVSFLIATVYRHKFSKLPPTVFPTIPIIGHLYLLKQPLHRTFAKLTAKHGPILLLRFGSRNVLVLSSPSLAEECFTKNDIIFANRPRLLAGKILGYNYTSLGLAPYGDHWRNLRRISAIEVFSSQRMQQFSSIRVDEARLLVKKLVSESSKPVNLHLVFDNLIVNVIMRIISGKRYFDGDSDLEEEGKVLQQIVKDTFLISKASNLGDSLPFLRWLGVKGLEKKLISLQETRNNFIQGLINQLRKVENKKQNLIHVLLHLQETDPDYYTDEMIKSFVLNLLAAGVDTSSTTMEWAFSLLLNHTHVLKKAQKEIDNHVGKDRFVDESDMANLPYIRCIINETLRMYPAVPLLVPHASSDDCVVGGYHVPGETMLLVNQWAIQRDPNVWSEPERFYPERFERLEGTRDGYKLMPFGSGRRSCPGEGLAIRVMGLAIGLLIQCFDWERVSEEMVDKTEGYGMTMPKAQPLVAKCIPRQITHKLKI
ncbi:cytochrome P450-like protein [Tanacetum coccineum]